MGSKVNTPSTTSWTETELQTFIAWVEKTQVGKLNITFSNIDNTLEPKIQAGSLVEIAGALYQFGSEEAATGWSGIANGTQAYMRLITSNDNVSAEWTTTTPVWRDDHQGWYESGTDKRYVLLCYKDASGNYTEKSKYTQEHGNRWLENATFAGDNVFSGVNTFPKGVDLGGNGTGLKFKLFSGPLDSAGAASVSHGLTYENIYGITVVAETFDGGAWRTPGDATDAGFELYAYASSSNLEVRGGSKLENDRFRAVIWYI